MKKENTPEVFKLEPHMYEVSDEHLQITGFATLAEWRAYDLGKEHEELLFMRFIKNWNGTTNSQVGQALYDKMQEIFVNSSAYKEIIKKV